MAKAELNFGELGGGYQVYFKELVAGSTMPQDGKYTIGFRAKKLYIYTYTNFSDAPRTFEYDKDVYDTTGNYNFYVGGSVQQVAIGSNKGPGSIQAIDDTSITLLPNDGHLVVIGFVAIG